MNNLKYYINLINEARSHPDLNIKSPAIATLEKYKNQPGLYVHFNDIEKIGVNLQSKNTFGPYGVYAFPLDYAIQNYERIIASGIKTRKYMTILKAKSGINILDLGKIKRATLENIKNLVNTFSRKIKAQELTGNNRRDFHNIQITISSIARRIGRSFQSLSNSIFRKLGYDAIYDNNRMLNDNPNQIVFLKSNTFDILETVPFRK